MWTVAIGGGVLLFAVVGAFCICCGAFFRTLRRTLPREQKPRRGAAHRKSTAFMAASMQGVIQKLREQEKELERLHRIEKDRAEQTERLSEKVTRNMPAGLLVVNSTGIISSANPAAEKVLGIRAWLPPLQRSPR